MELCVLFLERYLNKSIIFDFDGVILDSMPIKTYAFREIFRDFDADAVEKLAQFHVKNGGISRFVKIRYFFEVILKQKVDDELILQYAEKFSNIVVDELLKPKYLILETIEFIESIYKTKKLFIASGAEEKELRYLCVQFGIDDYFCGIYGSPTPKSDILAAILGENGLSTDECIMIGDSINDYDASIKNNIAFYGFNNKELKGLGNYIDSFKGFCID